MYYNKAMSADHIYGPDLTLVALGAGNSVEHGPSNQTYTNGLSVAALMCHGYANTSLAFALGRGPQEIAYPVSEAVAMKNIILGMYTSVGSRFGTTLPLPDVIIDEDSTNTFSNMRNLATLYEPFKGEIPALGIVAASGHAERACKLAKKILGNGVEIVPIHAPSPRSVVGRMKEIVLRGITSGITIGLPSGDTEEYEKRMAYYQKAMRPLRTPAVYLGTILGSNSISRPY
jgi:hypothetical protein